MTTLEIGFAWERSGLNRPQRSDFRGIFQSTASISHAKDNEVRHLTS